MNKITAFVKIFTNDEIKSISKIGGRYYLVSQELLDFRNKISENPFNIGVFLGEEKKDFKPSLALLEILARKTHKKISVNEKSEWLFLCGRDIFEEGLINADNIKKFEEGSFVLVQNKNDENLGMGRIEIKNAQTVIKNIIDRGNFLRREKQK
ncbi:MAG: hypothetical protein QXG00_01405 [Candidatus Woesearchaeota archaeon]